MTEGARGTAVSDDGTGLVVIRDKGDEVVTGAKVIGADVTSGDTVGGDGTMVTVGDFVTFMLGFDIATGGEVKEANGLPVDIATGAKVIGVDVITG